MGIQSLDRAQILAVLAVAREKRERDFLMILLAFLHGLRASEVVALRADSFSETHLTVQRLKGSLKTSQPLLEHENPLLNERKAVFDFSRGRPRNQRLFKLTRERFFQIFREHAKAAGIPKHMRHPHVLKHSIAMQIIESAGIVATRQYLGHKSIKSTGEYLKVNDEEASAAVKKVLSL
jgi:integrase